VKLGNCSPSTSPSTLRTTSAGFEAEAASYLQAAQTKSLGNIAEVLDINSLGEGTLALGRLDEVAEEDDGHVGDGGMHCTLITLFVTLDMRTWKELRKNFLSLVSENTSAQ